MSIFGWSMPAGCNGTPYDNDEVYEQKIGGVWYAWDEADNVYRHDPKHPEARDDGYVYMGKIIWPSDIRPEFDSGKLLREFVAQQGGRQ